MKAEKEVSEGDAWRMYEGMHEGKREARGKEESFGIGFGLVDTRSEEEGNACECRLKIRFTDT